MLIDIPVHFPVRIPLEISSCDDENQRYELIKDYVRNHIDTLVPWKYRPDYVIDFDMLYIVEE